MDEFAVGDRVMYTSGSHGDRLNNPLWGGNSGEIEGTITKIQDSSLKYRVVWDNERTNTYGDHDIELICDEADGGVYSQSQLKRMGIKF